TDEIGVAYNNFLRGPIKPHIPCSNRQAIFFQLETPGRFEAAHSTSQRIIPKVVRSLRETLREIVFLDPHPSRMRDYAYAKDDVIKEDGSNLSAVLYKIANAEHGIAPLLDFIRSLPEQDITDVQFIKTDRNDLMVRLVESFGDQQRTMDAPLLSDGTLRVLAVGAALLTAPQGALVIIEEIDNGVHPSRAEALVRQIRGIASARGLRVLLTSHNPALLDALPDDALGDVVCCYRDPVDGDSRLVRLGDLDRYPELIAQGPLGQLMTQRVLDRFVKDESTAEQRQAAALDWLGKLRETGQAGYGG
ncbi:MAG: ATP-binding protein, partial [Lamprobacter sp.]|uniref:AAA family ATPase n=1 Tax=Lamprobacter sp. TaxID=3100796 RepID=UPI002B25AB6D